MIFFIPDLKRNDLSGEEAAHFFSMRVKAGEQLKATDLKGQLADITIISADKNTKQLTFKIDKLSHSEPRAERILLQAIPDKQYLDKLMEVLPFSKISKAYLFFSDFSPVYNINIERLKRICIRSCEQAELSYVPQFELVQQSRLQELLKIYKPILLDTGITQPNSTNSENPNTCLIGPEGGWSRQELTFFESIKLNKASLGDLVWPAWLAGLAWFNSSN